MLEKLYSCKLDVFPFCYFVNSDKKVNLKEKYQQKILQISLLGGKKNEKVFFLFSYLSGWKNSCHLHFDKCLCSIVQDWVSQPLLCSSWDFS